MANRVSISNPQDAIVDNGGKMTNVFRAKIQSLTERALIVGQGNPEGIFEASQGCLFMDENADTGDILYIKRLDAISGDRSQGWRAI